MQDPEKERIKAGLFIAFYFLALLWLVKLVEVGLGYKFLYEFGILPREIKGLPGIITAPFIHSGFIHLFNNSVPLFVSIVGIVYFFPGAATRVFILIYFTTNILVWVFARDSYHIGASGIVYGYISFLFFGGSFARNKNMLAISLIIMFLYGAMLWGIFPQKGQISWESHLFGAATGLIFAIIFRKYAIPSEAPEHEDDEDDEENIEETDQEEPNQSQINYMFTREE